MRQATSLVRRISELGKHTEAMDFLFPRGIFHTLFTEVGDDFYYAHTARQPFLFTRGLNQKLFQSMTKIGFFRWIDIGGTLREMSHLRSVAPGARFWGFQRLSLAAFVALNFMVLNTLMSSGAMLEHGRPDRLIGEWQVFSSAAFLSIAAHYCVSLLPLGPARGLTASASLLTMLAGTHFFNQCFLPSA